jgi:Lrp/AsnC family leucine-responsive transcriptional regulator
MSTNGTLDSVDHAILRLLSADGRMAWAHLGARVGLSAPAVADRVRRLERIGAIKQYVTLVDPGHADCGILAFVAARVRRGDSRQAFQEWLRTTPAVLECHRVDGDYDYLLKLRCRDTADLDRVMDDIPRAAGGASTRITMVLVTMKETPELPLGRGDRRNGRALRGAVGRD